MIKCACKGKDCKTEIRFDRASRILWFIDKDGQETAMYLDPNSIAELIGELRKMLIYIIYGKGIGEEE